MRRVTVSSPSRRVLAGLLAAASIAAVAPAARADTVTSLGYSLPTKRYATSAVWTGDKAYVFAGNGVTPANRQIVRYDPFAGSGNVTPMSATFPAARYDTSAIWTGQHAYIFGGYTGLFTPTDRIYRYDPATDTLTEMGARLPFARAATAAVWTGQYAYVFGGFGVTQILRYHPATDTIVTLSSSLPYGGGGRMGAVWTGAEALLFGGTDEHYSRPTDRILSFNPSNGAVTTMAARLPLPRAGVAAVFDGHNALIFGGYDYSGAGTNIITFRDIVKYRPGAPSVELMSKKLPTAYMGQSAIWYANVVYLFGGYYETRECYDSGYGQYCYTYYYFSAEILRYTLEPGTPGSVTAVPGPGSGDVTVYWNPPAANTHSAPIVGYRVWRSAGFSGARTEIAEVAGTSYIDKSCALATQCWYEVSALTEFAEGPRGGLAVVVGWKI